MKNARYYSSIKLLQLILQGTLAFVFLVAGVLNLSGTMTEEMMRLGYPEYFTIIVGVGYIVGVICIYQRHFAFLQEWVFGAMAAALVGAAGSHVLVGDPLSSATPAIVTLTLLVVAYSLRRRLRDD